MPKDVSDAVRDALGNVLRDAMRNVGDVAPQKKAKSPPLSGVKGIAAGVGLAALAPLARKGVSAVRSGNGLPTPSPTKLVGKAASKATDRIGAQMKGAVGDKVDEAGGAGGLVKDAASGLLPGGGGDDDGGGGKGGMPGVGKGRRMPVQQSMDVAVPIETAYNQWTQYEDWPQFMQRVIRVSQDDETTVKFAVKIWGKTKEFEAKIITQRPDERVKWTVSQGITHTGVVTFHELAPKLTRMELTLDVAPGSLLEKAARGMRHIKRAARADLHRYKAFIEMQERETGAWRGRIEDSEVVEDHDESYDEDREYAEVEDIYEHAPQSGEDDEDDEGRQDEGDENDDATSEQRDRAERFRTQAERAGSGASESSRSGGSRSGSGSGSRSGASRSSGNSRSGGSGGGSGSGSGSSGGGKPSSSGRATSGPGSSRPSSGARSGGSGRSSSRGGGNGPPASGRSGSSPKRKPAAGSRN